MATSIKLTGDAAGTGVAIIQGTSGSGGQTFTLPDAGGVLQVAGGATGAVLQQLTGSGNFTVPAGVSIIQGYLKGAGGAGSDGEPGNGIPSCGGQGGAGGLIQWKSLLVTPDDVLAYAVGTGGSAAQNQTGGSGNATNFSTLVASGGSGGQSCGGCCNTCGSGGTGGTSGGAEAVTVSTTATPYAVVPPDIGALGLISGGGGGGGICNNGTGGGGQTGFLVIAYG